MKIPDKIVVNRGYYSLGLVGFLLSLTDRPEKDKAVEMANVLHKNIPMMFHGQFVGTLKRSNLFQQVKTDAEDKSVADALLIIEIESFGFGINNKPNVCATGKLILQPSIKRTTSSSNAESAQPVWQKRHTCEVGQFVELPNESMKFYANNLDKTREIFSIALQSVVDQLINDMKENYE